MLGHYPQRKAVLAGYPAWNRAGKQRGPVGLAVLLMGHLLDPAIFYIACRIHPAVVNLDGNIIEPYNRDNSIPIRNGTTTGRMAWKDGGDLSMLAGRPVRLRFHLRRGQFYSFWVSPEISGASQGYVAAGGPGFTGPTDTVGKKTN